MHYSNDPKKPQQHHNDQSNEPLAQQNPPQSQHEVMRQRHHSQHNHQKQHSLIAIKETVGALVVWNQLSYGGFLANALWHFLPVPWAIFLEKIPGQKLLGRRLETFLEKTAFCTEGSFRFCETAFCTEGRYEGSAPNTLLYRREISFLQNCLLYRRQFVFFDNAPAGNRDNLSTIFRFHRSP